MECSGEIRRVTKSCSLHAVIGPQGEVLATAFEASESVSVLGRSNNFSVMSSDRSRSPGPLWVRVDQLPQHRGSSGPSQSRSDDRRDHRSGEDRSRSRQSNSGSRSGSSRSSRHTGASNLSFISPLAATSQSELYLDGRWVRPDAQESRVENRRMAAGMSSPEQLAPETSGPPLINCFPSNPTGSHLLPSFSGGDGCVPQDAGSRLCPGDARGTNCVFASNPTGRLLLPSTNGGDGSGSRCNPGEGCSLSNDGRADGKVNTVFPPIPTGRYLLPSYIGGDGCFHDGSDQRRSTGVRGLPPLAEGTSAANYLSPTPTGLCLLPSSLGGDGHFPSGEGQASVVGWQSAEGRDLVDGQDSVSRRPSRHEVRVSRVTSPRLLPDASFLPGSRAGLPPSMAQLSCDVQGGHATREDEALLLRQTRPAPPPVPRVHQT